MKYVVLGAAGQLGRAFCQLLKDDAIPLTRSDVDLTNPERLQELLKIHKPSFVINCAAYNQVDKAEVEMDNALTTNAWALRPLSLACASMSITLIHFSTDYVFGLDTERDQPFTEEDAPGPVSVYGMSKLTGEYVVRSHCPRHYVVRTCGLYGQGGNFVQTMLRLGKQGKPLKVVNDQLCTPSNVIDIAQASLELLASGQFGLYHLTNSGSCTWYEFAARIFELEEIDIDLTPISSEEYGAVARRPRYSVLSTNKAESQGVSPLRHWQAALSEYLSERK